MTAKFGLVLLHLMPTPCAAHGKPDVQLLCNGDCQAGQGATWKGHALLKGPLGMSGDLARSTGGGGFVERFIGRAY